MEYRLYILAGTFLLLVIALGAFFIALARARREARFGPTQTTMPEFVQALPPVPARPVDTRLDDLTLEVEDSAPSASLLTPLRKGEWMPPDEPATADSLRDASLSERIAGFSPVPDIEEPAFSVERYPDWQVAEEPAPQPEPEPDVPTGPAPEGPHAYPPPYPYPQPYPMPMYPAQPYYPQPYPPQPYAQPYPQQYPQPYPPQPYPVPGYAPYPGQPYAAPAPSAYPPGVETWSSQQPTTQMPAVGVAPVMSAMPVAEPMPVERVEQAPSAAPVVEFAVESAAPIAAPVESGPAPAIVVPEAGTAPRASSVSTQPPRQTPSAIDRIVAELAHEELAERIPAVPSAEPREVAAAADVPAEVGASSVLDALEDEEFAAEIAALLPRDEAEEPARPAAPLPPEPVVAAPTAPLPEPAPLPVPTAAPESPAAEPVPAAPVPVSSAPITAPVAASAPPERAPAPAPAPTSAEPAVARGAQSPAAPSDSEVWSMLREQQPAPTPRPVAATPEPAAVRPPVKVAIPATPPSVPAPAPSARPARPAVRVHLESGETRELRMRAPAKDAAPRQPKPRPEVAEMVMAAPVEMWFGEARVGVKAGTATYDRFRKYADALLSDLKATDAAAR